MKLLVVVFVQQVKGKAEFVVDHPNEEKAVCLDLVKGDVQDFLVGQSVIGYGYSSGGVG